jgi:hypothetical protein
MKIIERMPLAARPHCTLVRVDEVGSFGPQMNADWRRSIRSTGPKALFEQPAANDAIRGGIRIPFALLASFVVKGCIWFCDGYLTMICRSVRPVTPDAPVTTIHLRPSADE